MSDLRHLIMDEQRFMQLFIQRARKIITWKTIFSPDEFRLMPEVQWMQDAMGPLMEMEKEEVRMVPIQVRQFALHTEQEYEAVVRYVRKILYRPKTDPEVQDALHHLSRELDALESLEAQKLVKLKDAA